MSLIIVLSANYLSFRSINNLKDNAKLVSHTHEVINASKEGEFSIVRSETNVRYLAKSVCNILKFKADEKGISLVTDMCRSLFMPIRFASTRY